MNANNMWHLLVGRTSFATYTQPFPILVSDSYSPNANWSAVVDLEDDYVPLTNPIYEFNPCESMNQYVEVATDQLSR